LHQQSSIVTFIDPAQCEVTTALDRQKLEAVELVTGTVVVVIPIVVLVVVTNETFKKTFWDFLSAGFCALSSTYHVVHA